MCEDANYFNNAFLFIPRVDTESSLCSMDSPKSMDSSKPQGEVEALANSANAEKSGGLSKNSNGNSSASNLEKIQMRRRRSSQVSIENLACLGEVKDGQFRSHTHKRPSFESLYLYITDEEIEREEDSEDDLIFHFDDLDCQSTPKRKMPMTTERHRDTTTTSIKKYSSDEMTKGERKSSKVSVYGSSVGVSNGDNNYDFGEVFESVQALEFTEDLYDCGLAF